MSLESVPCHVHIHYCVSAAREVEVPAFVCLYNSCIHVTEVSRPRILRLTLGAVMQNDGDFVDVMQQYKICISGNILQ